MQIIDGLTEDTMESDPMEGGQRSKKNKKKGDFVLDVKSRQASLTEAGLNTVYRKLIAASSGNAAVVSDRFKTAGDPVMLWEEEEPWGPYIINAIKAEHLYKRDLDYILDSEDRVKIINRSTGRVQTKSRWTDNIHQARCMLCSHTVCINSTSCQAGRFFYVQTKVGAACTQREPQHAAAWNSACTPA